MPERNEIRISIARAIKENTPEERQTTAILGPEDGLEDHTESPKVYHIPCEHAAVVWYDFLGTSEHKAYDCRLDDGAAAAADLISDFIDDSVALDSEEPVPINIDGPEDDVEEILSNISAKSSFYEVSK